MQDKLLVNPVLANTNYDNIAALQQKRTLAFVNHFILTTVQFLNNFAKHCEQKLMHFENKLEKINATMVLLETRLSSIPEVNNVTAILKVEESIDNVSEDITTEKNSHVEENEDPVKEEYKRFVKMVQVGVPLQAVKLKISLEGLDPDELDKILKMLTSYSSFFYLLLGSIYNKINLYSNKIKVNPNFEIICYINN